VKNGADATGSWQVKFSSDYGQFAGIMQLKRDGNNISGTWSGDLGDGRPIRGAWRNGYIELSFDAEWRNEAADNPVSAAAILAGWIDGDAGSGRMSVQGRADGRWTATRKPQ
jgi:hypothetical protein